jgi:hypothetical protein
MLKKTSNTTEDQADPIQFAITDFSKNSKLYKKNIIFYVTEREAVNNKNIVIISITKNFTKLLLTSQSTVGSKGKMPSRYVEKEGKLFYWWDDNYALTKEALAVFRKYNLLQDDMGGTIQLPDNILDEKQQSAIYYFCKNNFAIYKKIVTNKGRFYDQAPEMHCDNLKN